MFRRKKYRSIVFVCILLAALFICGEAWIMAPSSATEEAQSIFSYGSGPIDVFIFTDYFCPPCRGIEAYLEKALTDLHRLGVRVSFVDKPIYEKTPMYSRYFLYAAKASDSFAEILRIRRVLFDIAGTKTVNSEGELLQKIKENNIRLVLMEVKPIFDQWAELIGRFSVKGTPTCIVARPGQDAVTFNGSFEIPQGIDRLLKELSGGLSSRKE
jgi:thiol:disulfide interchange protein DsbA